MFSGRASYSTSVDGGPARRIDLSTVYCHDCGHRALNVVRPDVAPECMHCGSEIVEVVHDPGQLREAMRFRSVDDRSGSEHGERTDVLQQVMDLYSGMAQSIAEQIEHTLAAQMTPQSHPAARDVVNALPRSTTDSTAECPVCLEALASQRVLTLPCAHALHESCALAWLVRRHTCPVCRHALPVEHDGA